MEKNIINFEYLDDQYMDTESAEVSAVRLTEIIDKKSKENYDLGIDDNVLGDEDVLYIMKKYGGAQVST